MRELPHSEQLSCGYDNGSKGSGPSAVWWLLALTGFHPRIKYGGKLVSHATT